MKSIFNTKIICPRKILLPLSLERLALEKKKRRVFPKFLKCTWMSLMGQNSIKNNHQRQSKLNQEQSSKTIKTQSRTIVKNNQHKSQTQSS